jgi:hypothetical protein
MPSKNVSEPSRKSTKIEARISEGLKEKADAKARACGWNLAGVLRALLTLWISDDVVSPSRVGDANVRAPRLKKKKNQDSAKN